MTITVETIAPNGLGYGEGSISAKNAEAELVKKVEDASKDPRANIKISNVDYDTCSDGRCTSCIQCIKDGEIKQSFEQTFCYKSFGSGITMGVAGNIAVGNNQISTVAGQFDVSSKTFDKTDGLEYAVHSSDHASGNDSGCGAIDNAPVILKNAIKYKQQIIDTMAAVFGENSHTDSYMQALHDTYANFEEFVVTDDFKNEEYAGADIVGHIAESGRKVKVLSGSHRELRVRINVDIDEHTTNQAFIREAANDEAQIFAVDVPRMKQIADKMHHSLDNKRKALMGMMIYSLATAATLTDGTLPVDKIYAKYPCPSADVFKSHKKTKAKAKFATV